MLHFKFERDKINNGFSEKIGTARELQKMHELQNSLNSLLEPAMLIEEIKKLIQEADVAMTSFNQNKLDIFEYKKTIPANQLFALYAVNKISTIANRDTPWNKK